MVSPDTDGSEVIRLNVRVINEGSHQILGTTGVQGLHSFTEADLANFQIVPATDFLARYFRYMLQAQKIILLLLLNPHLSNLMFFLSMFLTLPH